MTYEKKIRLYKKISKVLTETYREKYPSLCYINLTQKPPLTINGHEFYYSLIMTVASTSYLPHLYVIDDIDETIYNYFGLRVDERKRKIIKRCPTSSKKK